MKPWSELSERGRLMRLRPLAKAALQDYSVDVEKLTLIGGFINALFRVDTADGPLALRVGLIQEHSEADTDVELAWLEAIASESEINVGRPIRTRTGELYAYASAPGVPDPRRCTLFTWVPGGPIADRTTPAVFEAYGRLSAQLHLHGATYRPVTQPMRWDRVFYFPESVDPVVYHQHGDRFPPGGLEVVQRAIDVVTPFLAGVSNPQIVHGDLHIWNVHARRNQVWALDFEDVLWGSRTQDLAISLYYLQDRPDTDELTANFRRGYRQVSPWPASEEELAAFMAARRLMFVNLVFNVGLDGLDEFLAHSVVRLQAFLDASG